MERSLISESLAVSRIFRDPGQGLPSLSGGFQFLVVSRRSIWGEASTGCSEAIGKKNPGSRGVSDPGWGLQQRGAGGNSIS